MSRILVIAASVTIALSAAASATAGSSASHGQSITIAIGVGDYLRGGGNFAIAPGVPVHVTVTNFTREFHTFTVPGLGVSELIRPANAHGPTATTFTFTTHEWGAFAWHCMICPSGMHGRRHQMGGMLYVLVSPSALP